MQKRFKHLKKYDEKYKSPALHCKACDCELTDPIDNLGELCWECLLTIKEDVMLLEIPVADEEDTQPLLEKDD